MRRMATEMENIRQENEALRRRNSKPQEDIGPSQNKHAA